MELLARLLLMRLVLKKTDQVMYPQKKNQVQLANSCFIIFPWKLFYKIIFYVSFSKIHNHTLLCNHRVKIGLFLLCCCQGPT